MKETVLDRLLRYVKIDTQSKEGSDTYPSTSKQFDLLNLLVEELGELGLSDVTMDQHGYAMATLPGNVPGADPAGPKVPPIGFIAHVDTSPSASGTNVLRRKPPKPLLPVKKHLTPSSQVWYHCHRTAPEGRINFTFAYSLTFP